MMENKYGPDPTRMHTRARRHTLDRCCASVPEWRRVVLRNLVFCTATLLAASSTQPCAAAPLDGVPDPSFGSAGISYVSPDDVDAREITPALAITLPDGKLLFAGARNKIVPPSPWYEPQIRGMLLRLNADGSADAGFGNTSIPGLFELPDLVVGTRMQSIESLVRLADGSIIAVGTGMVNSPQKGFIVKLGADGTLDTSFADQGSLLLPTFYPHTVAIDSQGRVLVAGEHFDNQGFIYTSVVMRLTSSGAVDTTYGTAGSVSIIWSDATLSGYVSELKVTTDDGVIIGGGFEVYGSGLGSDFALARLNASGGLDTSFNGTGWRVFHNPTEASTINRILRMTLMQDGHIAFAGYHSAGENITGLILGRVAADGSTDATFGDAASPGFSVPAILPSAESVNATALVMQGDGKLLVSTAAYVAPAKETFYAIRTTADGLLDPDFAQAGILEADLAPDGYYSEISAMTVQPDGRIVVGGRSSRSTQSPVVDFAGMRLLNPSMDNIFANGFDPLR
jgi:uncharacterized delta-60 repeat protein